jgi:hypothetical protein
MLILHTIPTQPSNQMPFQNGGSGCTQLRNQMVTNMRNWFPGLTTYPKIPLSALCFGRAGRDGSAAASALSCPALAHRWAVGWWLVAGGWWLVGWVAHDWTAASVGRTGVHRLTGWDCLRYAVLSRIPTIRCADRTTVTRQRFAWATRAIKQRSSRPFIAEELSWS